MGDRRRHSTQERRSAARVTGGDTYAARNIEEGGWLTIVATALIDTGSRMDEVISKSSTAPATLDPPRS
jgi:hypothetical protein